MPKGLKAGIAKMVAVLEESVSKDDVKSKASMITDPEAIEAMSSCEQILKAIHTGKSDSFSLRGALGCRWTRALKNNEELKSEYAEYKGHAAQQEFRKKWASEEWLVIAKERTAVERHKQTNHSNGQYEPAANIVLAEGGDKEAVVAATNYVNKCIAMGAPWVRRKDGISEIFEKEWSEVQKKSNPKDKPPALPAAGGEPTKTPGKRRRNDSPGANPTPDKKPARGGGFAPDVDADVRKDIDKSMVKSVVTRAQLHRALALQEQIITKCSGGDHTWAWANATSVLAPLRAARKELDHATEDRFWQEWMVQEPAEMKKRFKYSVIQGKLTELTTVAAAVSKLFTSINSLTAMHNVRSAAHRDA